MYVFSDGPLDYQISAEVDKVRKLLKQIDWCEVAVFESEKNLGLGKSILAGVTQVFENEDAAIVFEDDLICVPKTYEFLVSALIKYKDNSKVMSVTGWTHPRIAPRNVRTPYFDGKAECWTWGTWSKHWSGMEFSARQLMKMCAQAGIDVEKYGNDLPKMAYQEETQNLWAVRWMYLHILKRGLCLRPPRSLVEHIGFDERATTSAGAERWKNPPLKPVPKNVRWGASVEHPECSTLWKNSILEM